GMHVTRAGEVAEPHSEPMHLVEELSGAARLGLRHTPAFEVADGAFRALVAVRTALGMTS
ncbi:MAG TPA: hypothetical protein VM580_24405, partial [Labilithrix sp.]|nr:hypothetical protein [Labilithrix sp.]